MLKVLSSNCVYTPLQMLCYSLAESRLRRTTAGLVGWAKKESKLY